MRLTKDKTAILDNDFLTLVGVPPEASTDPRSGITKDPNREDELDYVVKLVCKVISVSLQTQKLIAAPPELSPSDSNRQEVVAMKGVQTS